MTRKSISELLHSKKGSTLITVVILFLFFMIIVSTSAIAAQSNIKRAVTTNQYESAYYVAETGLSEYTDKITDFINTSTKDYSGNFAQLVTDFLVSNSASPDGVITSDYGQVMDKPAIAKIHLVLDQVADTSATFTLTSQGTLNNSERTVSKSFVFTQSSSGEYEYDGFNSNGLITIDLTATSNTAMGVPANGTTLTGPVITNKPIDFTSEIIINSAVVTNNNITIPNGITLRGVLITSGKIEINTKSGNASLHTVVLKKGGSIYVNLGYVNALNTIDYVLVPEEYKNSLSSVITYKTDSDTNNAFNAAAYEKIKSKVIFYKQLNFNPWDMSFYSDSSIYPKSNINPVSIFGEKPTSSNNALDYGIYFQSDFVLDNMDKPDIVDDYVPTVVMPQFPETTSANAYNQTGKAITVSPPGNEGTRFEIVSANNEFRYYSEIAYQTNYRTLDLSQGSQKVYSFESFKVEVPTEGVNDKTLTINVGDKDVSLVVKSFNIVNASLKVVGTGSLSVYVTGNNGVTKPTDLTLSIFQLGLYNTEGGENQNDPTKFKVFVKSVYNTDGSLYNLSLGNNQRFDLYASVYSQNLNVTFDSPFKGAFVSIDGTSINKSGSGNDINSPLIFAPKAIFENRGLTTGFIVVKNFKFGDWGDLSFNQQFDKNTLEDILGPVIAGSTNGSGGNGSGTTNPGTNQKILTWGSSKELGGD
ncbi:hypothetical protein AOC36_04005 [Erysipelothrix larvae]|uniref:Type 4 fimbrial biogenesis protein PilX N-terminal domain-containing protein n=1 Tax=Erysipelothrix larvae TaxID=1514105 RepID=A0A109UGT2_9FIRM|nr:hypothetical protein [Erysipelothrix larvae]AMC93163.1 hypothetical protein AOC36_04005 [Erysipelothrix larvae]